MFLPKQKKITFHLKPKKKRPKNRTLGKKYTIMNKKCFCILAEDTYLP